MRLIRALPVLILAGLLRILDKTEVPGAVAFDLAEEAPVERANREYPPASSALLLPTLRHRYSLPLVAPDLEPRRHVHLDRRAVVLRS